MTKVMYNPATDRIHIVSYAQNPPIAIVEIENDEYSDNRDVIGFAGRDEVNTLKRLHKSIFFVELGDL